MSFVHLMNGQFHKHKLLHLSGEKFSKFLSEVRDLGMQQFQEDSAALASVQPMDVSGQLQASQRQEHDEGPE